MVGLKASETMTLDVGILIIGSLLWREDRQQWRDARLRMGSSRTATAPIRYGRKSQSWGDSYTMVLSRGCDAGHAKVVPCIHQVASIEDLVLEAEYLWKAEQPSAATGRLCASWGCVGLLINPERSIPATLLQEWAVRTARDDGYEHLTRSLRSDLIDRGGLLQIDWPRLAEGGAAADLDLLLATATKPTLAGSPPSYPSAETIADAWNAAEDHVRYFWNNVDNGITTFQDDQIRTRLRPRGRGQE